MYLYTIFEWPFSCSSYIVIHKIKEKTLQANKQAKRKKNDRAVPVLNFNGYQFMKKYIWRNNVGIAFIAAAIDADSSIPRSFKRYAIITILPLKKRYLYYYYYLKQADMNVELIYSLIPRSARAQNVDAKQMLKKKKRNKINNHIKPRTNNE